MCAKCVPVRQNSTYLLRLRQSEEAGNILIQRMIIAESQLGPTSAKRPKTDRHQAGRCIRPPEARAQRRRRSAGVLWTRMSAKSFDDFSSNIGISLVERNHVPFDVAI